MARERLRGGGRVRGVFFRAVARRRVVPRDRRLDGIGRDVAIDCRLFGLAHAMYAIHALQFDRVRCRLLDQKNIRRLRGIVPTGRADIPWTRGDAAAATWTFRGDESRRRRA